LCQQDSTTNSDLAIFKYHRRNPASLIVIQDG
jgi:hypothetical protein